MAPLPVIGEPDTLKSVEDSPTLVTVPEVAGGAEVQFVPLLVRIFPEVPAVEG